MGLAAGVIGCGNISRFHFSGLEKAGARVKWICDLNEAAARPWVEKTGAKYTADYKEIVADPEVDLVDVLTISSVHREICSAAIGAGKSVVCEKTLAETAEDAAEIVRLAAEKGTVFYTSYMKRFIPAVQKAKELLASLGRIIYSHFRVHQPWGDVWDRDPEGFGHTPKGGMSTVRKNYGGGILVCGGSHILDLVGFLLGRPTRLYGSVHTPEALDYDLRAMALLEFGDGSAVRQAHDGPGPCHFEALMHPHRHTGFLRDGWDEYVEIVGTKGKLEVFSSTWDQPEQKASLLVHYDNSTGDTIEHRFDPVSPFDRAMAFFCGNIARKEQGAQSRLTGYDVDQLISDIMRSSETGEAVEVGWRL